jgi:hypothetical protein
MSTTTAQTWILVRGDSISTFRLLAAPPSRGYFAIFLIFYEIKAFTAFCVNFLSRDPFTNT